MSKTVKDGEFRFQATDETGPGLQKAKDNVKAAASEMKGKMSGLVSAQTGKDLGHLNEQTERARQLFSAFGGELGQVSGQVVYMSGTIGAVIGKMSVWELGIVAAVGAITALGVAIYDLATDKLQRIDESLDHHEKTTKKLVEQTNQLYMAEYRRFYGIDREQVQRDALEFELQGHEKRMEMIQAERDSEIAKAEEMLEMAALRAKVSDSIMLTYQARISRQQDQINDTKQALKELGKAADMKAVLESNAIIFRQIAEGEKELEKQRQERLKKWRASLKEKEKANKEHLDSLKRQEETFNTLINQLRSGAMQSLDYMAEGGKKTWTALQAAGAKERNIEAQKQADLNTMIQQEHEKRMEMEGKAIKARLEVAEMGAEGTTQLIKAAMEGNLAGAAAAMAQQAAMEAAYHGMVALVSLILGQPQVAAQHAAAAALYAGFAAAYGGVALIVGAGSGGGGGAASDRGGYSPVTQAPERPVEPQRTIVLRVDGNAYFSRDAEREMSNMIDGYTESQNPGRVRNKL